MPRKDRTFTNSDLTRLACHNLAPEEQVNVVHNLLGRKNHLPAYERSGSSAIDETVDHRRHLSWGK